MSKHVCIPNEKHQKLKMVAIATNKGVSELVCDLIDSLPNFEFSEKKGTIVPEKKESSKNGT